MKVVGRVAQCAHVLQEHRLVLLRDIFAERLGIIYQLALRHQASIQFTL